MAFLVLSYYIPRQTLGTSCVPWQLANLQDADKPGQNTRFRRYDHNVHGYLQPEPVNPLLILQQHAHLHTPSLYQ